MAGKEKGRVIWEMQPVGKGPGQGGELGNYPKSGGKLQSSLGRKVLKWQAGNVPFYSLGLVIENRFEESQAKSREQS